MAHAMLDRWAHRVQGGLLTLAAALPLAGALYLWATNADTRLFADHAAHEAAIGISVLVGAFVAFVAWRCHRASSEAFVGWLALAFLGETLVYAPHGLLTGASGHHLAAFLIFGPVSRLVMAVLLLAGLRDYLAEGAAPRERTEFAWWRWIAAFLLLDIVIGVLAWQFPWMVPLPRLAIEGAALLAAMAAVVLMLWRPQRSPLMRLFVFAEVGFATSSLCFLVVTPWSHLWWYAHGVFAGGFLVLGYGVLEAFRVTGSFSGVFSQQEMMAQLRAEKQRAEQAARQLGIANARLEILAITDPLTDVANRRCFMERAAAESERRERSHTPLTVMVADLDHFKLINDRFGHHSGDHVLRMFAETAETVVRKCDLVGRVGGEEFAVLMPDTALEQGVFCAQRLRAAVSNLCLKSDRGQPIPVSVSIGLATLGADGADIAAVLRKADERLYAAKAGGRDRVVWADQVPEANPSVAHNGRT